MKEKIKRVQEYLKQNNKDSWIIYDYECTNATLVYFIGKRFLTRRFFLVIEKENAYVICHSIDAKLVEDLKNEFDILVYNTWKEMNSLIENNFSKYQNSLVEICEEGTLPRCARCDYGTVEFIKKYVKNIENSLDLQLFNSLLTEKQLNYHKSAMDKVVKIKDEAFDFIENNLRENKQISEYDVQQFIVKRFKEENLFFDSAPIVAVNENAGNPHYEPKENLSKQIKKGDLILIDLWARENEEEGVFADITHMAFAGKEVPENYVKIFNILKTAIEKGLEFLNNNLSKRFVCGYEVDDVVRSHISENGYGEYFTHRTGHSISKGNSSHGDGVNIDNYETHDVRHILNNSCFSIEPGIYTKDFGFREEINVVIINNKAAITSPIQQEIRKMLID